MAAASTRRQPAGEGSCSPTRSTIIHGALGWSGLRGRLIELADQPGLRLTSNVVDCDPAHVYIGMVVEVTFQRQGRVFIPLFRPVTPEAGGVQLDRHPSAR